MRRYLIAIVLASAGLAGLSGCEAYVEPAPVVYRPYYYDPYYGGPYCTNVVVVRGGGYYGGGYHRYR